jgi:hypothetical protein
MIMPAAPKPGDVSRPENIPGLVWEEVAVKEVGKTVRGPRGPVSGALVGGELHDDGSVSDKIFVPGYGEFYSAHQGDIEVLALALPIDAKPGPAPSELRQLSRSAWSAFRAAGAERWGRAAGAKDAARRAWKSHSGAPPRLVAPTKQALARLARAVKAEDRLRARHAALDLALAALDLRLQYEPLAAIERARFELWAQQTRVDAASRNLAGLRADVATLEWIRDRLVRTIDGVRLARLDAGLEELRANVTDRELGAAAQTAGSLEP